MPVSIRIYRFFWWLPNTLNGKSNRWKKCVYQVLKEVTINNYLKIDFHTKDSNHKTCKSSRNFWSDIQQKSFIDVVYKKYSETFIKVWKKTFVLESLNRILAKVLSNEIHEAFQNSFTIKYLQADFNQFNQINFSTRYQSLLEKNTDKKLKEYVSFLLIIL